VPVPELVAVVALRRIACSRAEILEVPGGTRRVVLVIAGHRPRHRLHSSPRSVVRGLEGVDGPDLVLDVSECEHGFVTPADEEVGGRALAAAEAGTEPVPEPPAARIACDVPGCRATST